MLLSSIPGGLSADCFLCLDVLPPPEGTFTVFCQPQAISPPLAAGLWLPSTLLACIGVTPILL